MREIKKISKEEYYKIPKDYRGIYEDYQGYFPHLKGKRTMLSLENGATVLLIEGSSFEIIE